MIYQRRREGSGISHFSLPASISFAVQDKILVEFPRRKAMRKHREGICRSRSLSSQVLVLAEALELRRLLSTTDIGTLDGRAYFANQSVSKSNLNNDYRFTLASAAHVQVQGSRAS